MMIATLGAMDDEPLAGVEEEAGGAGSFVVDGVCLVVSSE